MFYNNITYINITGGSLDRYGQIPEAVLGRVAVSVVKGLQYLWSLKIMHRGMFFLIFVYLSIPNEYRDAFSV